MKLTFARGSTVVVPTCTTIVGIGGPAGATQFDINVSPSSGGPGTRVEVSGGHCAPGASVDRFEKGVHSGSEGAVASDLTIRLEPALGGLRDFRRRLLRELPMTNARDDVVLVTSELAANAILHGAPPIDVRVAIDDHIARVEVTDSDPEMGQPNSESRGLMLIGRIARASGITYQPGRGKQVWAELGLHNRAFPSARHEDIDAAERAAHEIESGNRLFGHSALTLLGRGVLASRAMP